MDAVPADVVNNPTLTVSPSGAPSSHSANALRHGLTGKKLLPPELRAGRVEELYEQLVVEMQPRSPLAKIFLREIARHAAVLETIEGGEGAVQRLASSGVASLLVGGGMTRDTALAAAVTAEPLDRVGRYRRAHEKALYSAIKEFERLQELPARTASPAPASSNTFTTVADCEQMLRQRFASSSWRCPSCGGHPGSYSGRLKNWTCARCSQSVGLREGTIFARSPIPLPVWFRAVAIVADNLAIAADDLAAQLGMTRVATARGMRQKIKGALAAGTLQVRLGVAAAAFLRNETRLPTNATGDVKVKLGRG